MAELQLIYAVLVPWLLGVPVLLLLGVGPGRDRVGFPAWSWLLGCLSLAVTLRVCRELGLSPHVWPFAPALLAVVLIALAFRNSARPADHPVGRPAAQPATAPSIGVGYLVFVALGVALVVWFALAGLDRPCVEGDEGNIWSLKAKSLLVDWGGGPSGFTAAQVHNLHPDYPQLNPWLQAWIYVNSSTVEFTQFANRWLVQLCGVALFAALAAGLRRWLRPVIAIPFASLLLLEPEFQSLAKTAYADGMVALGLVVALDGWLRCRAEERGAWPWLAGAGLAFAAWSKNETMLYLASLAIAAVLVRLLRRFVGGAGPAPHLRRAGLLALLPVIAVVANTSLWNRRFGMKSDLFGNNPTGKSMFQLMAEQWPDRVPVLGGEVWTAALALDHVHAVFVLPVVMLVLLPNRLFHGFALPVLGLAGAIAGLHVVYIGSFLPLRFHLDTSYLRVLFQLVPVAILLTGAMLAAIVTPIATPGANRQTAGAP
ncbi:MAG: hypothetical protein NXI31_13065 [bacterium]|nr:hypothetical protein [bacterium]